MWSVGRRHAYFKRGAVGAPTLVWTSMDNVRFLSGQLLLAMPGIGDPRFERAAIAVCTHDDDGALGVGVGETIDGLTLHTLLRQVDIEPGVAPDVPIHLGGPMETRRGFVLHDSGWGGQDTIDVGGRFALSGTLDVLRAIAEGSGPDQFVVALGYAGWDAGQLERELTQHGWMNVPADRRLLFDVPTSSRWREGFHDIGIDPRMLAPTGGTA